MPGLRTAIPVREWKCFILKIGMPDAESTQGSRKDGLQNGAPLLQWDTLQEAAAWRLVRSTGWNSGWPRSAAVFLY